MSTSTQPATGLDGATGYGFRVAQNQRMFVENSAGKLPALSLFPTATIVAQSASTVLKGTFTFDFDAGVEGRVSATADVFWEQKTAVSRSMYAFSTAKILNLGAVDFNGLSPSTLGTLPYGTTPIPGSDDATNKLTPGDVFAVQTTSGNFAKVQVIRYGCDLTIRWVTYKLNSGYSALDARYNQLEDAASMGPALSK